MPIYFTAFVVGHMMLTLVIGVIETLVHPRKIKTETPTCPLCAHSMWSLSKTGLASDIHGPE